MGLVIILMSIFIILLLVENYINQKRSSVQVELIAELKKSVQLKTDQYDAQLRMGSVLWIALQGSIENHHKKGNFKKINIWLHDQYWQITWDDKEKNISINSNPDLTHEEMSETGNIIN